MEIKFRRSPGSFNKSHKLTSGLDAVSSLVVTMLLLFVVVVVVTIG
jgi:hypothetical protein